MQSSSVYLARVILQSFQHQRWGVVLQRGAEVGAAALPGCHQLGVVTHSLQLHQDLKHADKMTRLQRLLSSEGAHPDRRYDYEQFKKIRKKQTLHNMYIWTRYMYLSVFFTK